MTLSLRKSNDGTHGTPQPVMGHRRIVDTRKGEVYFARSSHNRGAAKHFSLTECPALGSRVQQAPDHNSGDNYARANQRAASDTVEVAQ